MGWLYSWATRDVCLYQLSYDQLLIYWRDGTINSKKNAMRIAGLMWGSDIDAIEDKPSGHEPDPNWFKKEFGISYDELKNPHT